MREAEAPGEVAGEHCVLEPALDAIASADIDVVMNAHRVAGQAQRLGDLFGIFRHLDRRPDIEDLGAWIPLRNDGEGLDRDRGAAIPDCA